MNINRRQPLSELERQLPAWSRQAAYAAGDAGFNVYWVCSQTFLLFFYTDVYHLPVALVTYAVALGRTADLLAGGAIGMVIDRTRSRFGQYRPYLLWLIAPLGISFVLLFTAPPVWPGFLEPFATSGVVVAAAAAASTIFTVLYSAINVPYTAMLAVLAGTPSERVRFASFRFAFAGAAMLAVQLGTLTLVQYFGKGNEAEGWRRTALVYASIGSAALLACFAGTREIAPDQGERQPVWPNMRALAGAHEWQMLSAAMFLGVAGFSCRETVGIYYIRYVAARPDLTGIFLALYPVGTLIACAVLARLQSALLDTGAAARNCAAAGALVSLGCMAIPTRCWQLVLLGQLAFGLATGGFLPIVFALFTSLPQRVAALQCRSINGLVASTALLALKAGSLCGIALVTIMLSRAGYQPGMEQSSGARRAILIFFSSAPGLLFGLAAFTLGSAAKKERA